MINHVKEITSPWFVPYFYFLKDNVLTKDKSKDWSFTLKQGRYMKWNVVLTQEQKIYLNELREKVINDQ